LKPGNTLDMAPRKKGEMQNTELKWLRFWLQVLSQNRRKKKEYRGRRLETKAF